MGDTHISVCNHTNIVSRILKLIFEENKLNLPWSFDIQTIAKDIKKPIPPMNYITDELNSKGYKCFKTHYSGSCLKTDANYTTIAEIIGSSKSIQN